MDVCSSTVFSKSCGEPLFQHWEHHLLSYSDPGPPPDVSCCFPLNWYRAELSPSSNWFFLRHHQLGCALQWIHWSWQEAAGSGRGQPLAFSLGGNPCRPFPWVINLAKCIQLGKRDHHCQNLYALFFLQTSIQGSAHVGEANASQSHTYTWGTKDGSSSLVSAALTSCNYQYKFIFPLN